MRKNKVLAMTQFALLLAIEALFCFTVLGSLPAIGPIVATLAMLPVIITAILLGTKAGTLMGFFAGLFSFIVWTFMPPNAAVAFLFTPFYSFGDTSGNLGSLAICFIPRILTGTVTGLLHKAFSKAMPKKDYLNMTISSAIGSLVNTFGVLGGIWLFFGEVYASLVGSAILVIIGSTILTSGIPEAVVGAVVCPAVCKPVKILLKKQASKS